MQTRRELLKGLATAATATMALPEPRARASTAEARIVHPAARADAIIVIWMAGGMAAPDTFDPKKYKPFEPGLAVADVISTFPAIPTAIDGVQIASGLPEIAGVLDRATLIRSHVQPDLGSILHSRHQYHWHTGYVPPQTVACPHLGAWMSRVLGPRNPVMPAFVNIGQRLEGIGENEEIKAFTTAGFFGSEYGPMNLPYPEQAALAVRPPSGMQPGRFASRYEHFKKLVKAAPNAAFTSDNHQESMLRSLENAHRLRGAKEKDAFDITLEPQEVRDRYDVGGDDGRRFLTFRAMTLVVIVLLITFVLAVPIRQLIEQQSRINTLRAQEEANQILIRELSADIERWQDPAYVKAQAKSRLHY
ncbi:MAG: DUF1501 domain-containing protein, partial [Planctomycetia bacterium]